MLNAIKRFMLSALLDYDLSEEDYAIRKAKKIYRIMRITDGWVIVKGRGKMGAHAIGPDGHEWWMGVSYWKNHAIFKIEEDAMKAYDRTVNDHAAMVMAGIKS